MVLWTSHSYVFYNLLSSLHEIHCGKFQISIKIKNGLYRSIFAVFLTPENFRVSGNFGLTVCFSRVLYTHSIYTSPGFSYKIRNRQKFNNVFSLKPVSQYLTREMRINNCIFLLCRLSIPVLFVFTIPAFSFCAPTVWIYKICIVSQYCLTKLNVFIFKRSYLTRFSLCIYQEKTWKNINYFGLNRLPWFILRAHVSIFL